MKKKCYVCKKISDQVHKTKKGYICNNCILDVLTVAGDSQSK